VWNAERAMGGGGGRGGIECRWKCEDRRRTRVWEAELLVSFSALPRSHRRGFGLRPPGEGKCRNCHGACVLFSVVKGEVHNFLELY
jgi:hypothetical protein